MAATSRRRSEATFSGADGVVWSRNSWTTPPILTGLMRLRDFLLIVQPPLLLLRGEPLASIVTFHFGRTSRLQGTTRKQGQSTRRRRALH